jgi:hypothetical protein
LQEVAQFIHPFGNDEAGSRYLLGKEVPDRPSERTSHADGLSRLPDNGELPVDFADSVWITRFHGGGRFVERHVQQLVPLGIEQIDEPRHRLIALHEYLHSR